MSIDDRTGTLPRSRTTDLVGGETPIACAWLEMPARALLSALFLVSGFGKLAAVSMTQGYMKAFGIPPVLIWPAAALEIVCGILILIGLLTRPVAAVLAAWCLLTAAVFHTAFADQNQLINFLKNLGIAGGFVFLALHGARTLSVDRHFARRRGM